MTQKRVALQFLSAWGSYNKGDIAGFDADQAEALEAKKVAVKAKDQPAAPLASLTLAFDAEAFRNSDGFREISEQLEAATEQLAAREAALDARAAALDERAEELAGREYDLGQREAAIAEIEAELGAGPEAPELVEPEGEPAPAKASGLPKQGR